MFKRLKAVKTIPGMLYRPEPQVVPQFPTKSK